MSTISQDNPISILAALKYNRGTPNQLKAWEYLDDNLPDNVRTAFAKLYRQPEPPSTESKKQKSDVYIYVSDTGGWDEYGLRILQMDLVNGDQVVDSLVVCSGWYENQDIVYPTDDYSGSMRICPEGIYDIGSLDDLGYDPGDQDGFGRYTYSLTDRNASNNRSQLLIHCDRNRSTSPGSAGCLVTYTVYDMAKIKAWMDSKAKPQYLIVDLGTGFLAKNHIQHLHSKK